jgi:hypothetical protein
MDCQTQSEEANKPTAQELREKQKQLQGTIDSLTKTVEAMNETAKLLYGQSENVST